MSYLYLDIETVPVQSEEAKAFISAKVKPPAQMKKAETIQAWETEQKPAALEEAIAKTSFDAAFGQICCIGLAFNDSPATSISWPINAASEMLAIKGFFEITSDLIGNGFPTIVGHYIAGFDIKFIWQRCMVLGIRVPAWFPKDPKPWDGGIFDTMTAWAGPRDTISMDDLCRALGIEGKGDIDGSMIGRLFAEGKHEVIASYCRGDIDRTRTIHRKMMAALGEAA
jgi:hypothetical protein